MIMRKEKLELLTKLANKKAEFIIPGIVAAERHQLTAIRRAVDFPFDG